MYVFMLHLHNLLRWAVLIIGVIALIMAWAGVFGRSRWEGPLASLARAFTISFDVQVLVGLLLYVWLSPLTTSAFGNMSAAMSNPQQRFFVAEHLLLMIVAVVLVHIGSARGRKTGLPLQPAILYTLALVLVFAGIPWDRAFFPGM